MNELTTSEEEEYKVELALHLQDVNKKILATLLSSYIIHKNGRHWKVILKEIIELENQIKGN